MGFRILGGFFSTVEISERGEFTLPSCHAPDSSNSEAYCLYLDSLLPFGVCMGIKTTISIFIKPPPYKFGTRYIGFSYFTPVVVAVFGEIISRRLYDTLATVPIYRSEIPAHRNILFKPPS